jgi:intracellular septation protein A
MNEMKRLFNMEFLLSVILPVLLFFIFDRMNMTLGGTIAAGVWSLIMTIAILIKDRRINVYAIISLIFSAVGLVTTMISSNPVYYLASPIVSDLLLSLAFFISVAVRKPLIQEFAEYQMKDMFSPALRAKPMYRNAWMIITAAWGGLSLLQAAVRIVLLITVSNAVYYSVSMIVGNVTSILMLVGSVKFPKWYWKRESLKDNNLKGVNI